MQNVATNTRNQVTARTSNEIPTVSSNFHTAAEEFASKYFNQYSSEPITTDQGTNSIKTSKKNTNTSHKISSLSTMQDNNNSQTKLRMFENNSLKLTVNNKKKCELPTINSYTSMPDIPDSAKNNSKRSMILGNNRNVSTQNSLKESGICKQREQNNKFIGLENQLKDRFYSDIDKMFERKTSLNYLSDPSLKEKLATLKKVKDFWTGVAEFVTPILIGKRYQYKRKLYDFNKRQQMKSRNYSNALRKRSTDDLYTSDLYRIKDFNCNLYKKRAKPLLYTNFGESEKRHRIVKNQNEFMKEIEDSYKIYNFC